MHSPFFFSRSLIPRLLCVRIKILFTHTKFMFSQFLYVHSIVIVVSFSLCIVCSLTIFLCFILDKVHTHTHFAFFFSPLLVPDISFQVSGTGDFVFSLSPSTICCCCCFRCWSAAKSTSLWLGRKSSVVICFVISYFILFAHSFLSCSLTSVRSFPISLATIFFLPPSFP